jgi:hypothetical protein
MKKKVRKFGSGGDILTALGAGLAGYGAYKYLTKDKGESKDDDYTRRVKEFGRKGDFPDAKKEEKADAKKAEAKVADDRDEARERALKQSKDPKSNLVPEGADKDALYESDKALVRTDRKGASVKKKNDKSSQDRRQSQSGKTSKALQTYNSITAPNSEDKGGTNKSVVFKPASDAASTAKDKDKQAVIKAADSTTSTALPKAIDTKGTNKTVYGTDTTSVFQKRAAEQRAEQEAKAKKEKEAAGKKDSVPKNTFLTKERSDAAQQSMKKGFEMGLFERGNLGIGKKNGGTVKKYASGGSVSSASKRADGCAIRGKTRA